MRRTSYRPFTPVWLYLSELYIDRPGLSERFFPAGQPNVAICFSDVASRSGYCVLAVDGPADLHFGAAIDAYQQVARFSYIGGARIDNVTDWCLNRFHDHYEKGKGRRARPITKDAIFDYVYAILHDPMYRETYALNLKREFPRIPFFPDFWTWADWGKRLMSLHLEYSSAEPFDLAREDIPDDKARRAGLPAKSILKSSKEVGSIAIDSETTLRGVPSSAWSYVLGNRSALDWVLDQNKEKTPKDPVIREKFDTYRFADHKDRVIDLLKRVTTVSVETMKIVEAMKGVERGVDDVPEK